MDLALYAPGLGYYAAGARKFGAAGDFVTAPELSPLFAACLAVQAAEVLAETGGEVLELGAGSGRLAVDLMRELARLGRPPERYAILEPSPDLRQRQQARFAAEAPEWLDRVCWLDRLPERITGLVLGNEVLDALPVHLVHWQGGQLFERGVVLAGAGAAFAWQDRPLAGSTLAEAARNLPVAAADYLSEVGLAAPALVGSLAERLVHGMLLFIDYGFPRAEYYHRDRATGTLMCHYRHRAFDDPFYLPGLVDITAHVDFTAIADAALEAGLEVPGYTSQAHFLINCGLLERLHALEPGSLGYIKHTAQVQKLIQPSEMGELFKVIAMSKGDLPAPVGFLHGDKRHTL
ncbi:class I SAM-dependent methyltransferase [Parasulfuritortus cantonensis]|uniref:Class I SAM-dependent methyltransferase n=2 Tax=Parasulfuritortus cantonensis TaxID=2528202 RepID=A0A4R1B4H3_9PROT|nr:class I SAM-dependent methyltransferase [Parasulfuritortus cantonensis]